MEDDRIRIGIIGCGALGRVHARQFARMPDVRVAALSDPVPASLEAAAAELDDRPSVLATNYADILDSRLDAVCIASPDAFHVDQMLRALDAGLHVLCEKPLTPDPQDLQRVIAARDRARRVVALTYPRRYDPANQELKSQIQSGQWGTVKTITAYNGEDWITPNKGTWRHDPAVCPGGFFYDASGHQLDTLLWVSGLRAEWVTAEVENRGTPVPIVAWGHARLTGGVPLSFCFVGDAHSWREEINIHCERADFVMRNARAFRVDGRELKPLAPDAPHENSEQAFIRLIRSGGANWSPLEDVWPVLSLTRAALQSAESHQSVSIPTP